MFTKHFLFNIDVMFYHAKETGDLSYLNLFKQEED